MRLLVRCAAYGALGDTNTVLLRDVAVVGEQREVELVLGSELLVRVERIERNTDDRCLELVEIRDPVAKGFRLGNSTRGFVFGVEVQNHRLAAQVRQGDGLSGVSFAEDTRSRRLP